MRFRDCGWCHTVNIAMTVEWSSQHVRDSAGTLHLWTALSCPRCGRVTSIEVLSPAPVNAQVLGINERSEVTVLNVLPRTEDLESTVKHLPDDVAGFFSDARKALLAGLSDAAAVQLRKTLEGAAARKGIEEKTLVQSVTKMLDQNMLTEDFRGLLTHVRQIGNIGAHYSSKVLPPEEVERSFRFTTQVLRNLFEVPGELAELEGASSAEPDEDDPGDEVLATSS